LGEGQGEGLADENLMLFFLLSIRHSGLGLKKRERMVSAR
jgi:hypothetical protein